MNYFYKWEIWHQKLGLQSTALYISMIRIERMQTELIISVLAKVNSNIILYLILNVWSFG